MNEDKIAAATELLLEYEQADKAVTAAKQKLEEASKNRSDVVEKIYNKLGKGPFEYYGKSLGKIVIRGSTYFFRNPSNDNTIKIG